MTGSIKNLRDIDIDTECGRLLLVAVARLASTVDKAKTPDQVIACLRRRSRIVFNYVEAYPDSIKKAGGQ